MQDDEFVRTVALKRLGVLVGEWRVEASFPPRAPASLAGRNLVGRTVFEWILGGQFLLQRDEIAHPDAPDSWAIVGVAPDRQVFNQHYFDSRGVARIYAMMFDGKVWTLVRAQPDFTPLDFAQRFTGTVSADGRNIAGRWEICHPGSDWQHDFDLSFAKVR